MGDQAAQQRVQATEGLAGRILGRIERRRVVAIAAAILLPMVVGLLPVPAGTPSSALDALALTIFVVVLWATIAVPQPYAAAAFLVLVIATGTASPRAALSGFASNAIWLVLGGILIGMAADKSGLGRYIARRSVGRFRHSYAAMIGGLLVGTTLLSFLVPATMGRIAITLPVVMALARDADYPPGSPGYAGLVIAAVIGNFTIALAVLPGNLLNMMVMGSGETLYGMRISYLQYLVLCGPVIGVVKGLVCWCTILWLYPAPPPRSAPADEAAEPLGADGRRIAVIVMATILMWSTDIFHGFRPGTVAMCAGAACLLPYVGVLDPAEALAPRRLMILVWVATVLGLGAVLGEAGASALVSGMLAKVAAVEGKGPVYAYFALALIASATAVLMTVGGAIPIATAAVGGLAQATGLPVDTGVLAVLAGMSALFLPFEAAPVMVGLAVGRVGAGAATPFTLVSSALTCLIVLPLNAVWWRVLGVLP